MWGNMHRTHGAFSICMEMSGNGRQDWFGEYLNPIIRWLIPSDRGAGSYRRAGTTTDRGDDINASQANYSDSNNRNVGHGAPNPWGFSICMEIGGVAGLVSGYPPTPLILSRQPPNEFFVVSIQDLPCWFPKAVARELCTEG